MKKILILKIGGEGGSIKLFKINEYYTFTTNESALLDLLDNEDKDGIKFKSRSKLFDTLDLAMESMLNKYPVFRLYPLEINAQFKDQIKKYYLNYLTKDKKSEYLRNEEWEEILK